VDVFARAGQGLAAAHAAGLVHRDFKPNNVMIDLSGRLADRQGRGGGVGFRPARPPGALGPAPPLCPPRPPREGAGPGVLVGPPAYMAPEQLAQEPADARTDQFSFCVALYEALSGTRPFGGATLAELRQSILSRNLQKPAKKVPAYLLAAVERGLAPDP